MPFLDLEKISSDVNDIVANELHPDVKNIVKQVNQSLNLYNFRKHMNAHLQLHKDPKKRLAEFETKWKEIMETLLPKQQARIFNEVLENYQGVSPQEQAELYRQKYSAFLNEQAVMLRSMYPEIWDRISTVVSKSIKGEQLKSLKETRRQLAEQEKQLKQKKKKTERMIDDGSDDDLSDLDELADLEDSGKKKKKKKKRNRD